MLPYFASGSPKKSFPRKFGNPENLNPERNSWSVPKRLSCRQLILNVSKAVGKACFHLWYVTLRGLFHLHSKQTDNVCVHIILRRVSLTIVGVVKQ